VAGESCPLKELLEIWITCITRRKVCSGSVKEEVTSCITRSEEVWIAQIHHVGSV
jgi:hypothetical protein